MHDSEKLSHEIYLSYSSISLSSRTIFNTEVIITVIIPAINKQNFQSAFIIYTMKVQIKNPKIFPKSLVEDQKASKHPF